jgi:alpha-glucoside transport system substrate-binding protein
VASCLAVLAAAAFVGVRVYDREPTVTLLANWTGDDDTHFHDAVIRRFEHDHHVHVAYQGSSAESQVLGADVEAGTPPDVVVLTGPGELAAYARERRLVPVEKLIPQGAFTKSWTTPFDGHVYWFPLKADLKSIVWHPGNMTDAQIGTAAKKPGQWCLGMGSGATSGWPGTDWVEDILLQQSGRRTYERWARGQLPWTDSAVKRAWTTWRKLVVGPGTNDAVVRRALKTEYQNASGDVTKSPPGCTLEHQASFIGEYPAWKKAKGRYEPTSRLLGKGDSGVWEVSGDLVALLNPTPQAKQLIRYLASTTAQLAWSRKAPGFSVENGVSPKDYTTVGTQRYQVAHDLLDRQAVHCFDASDAMPPSIRDAFAQATIDYLARPNDLDEQLRTLQTLSHPEKTGKPGTAGLTWLPSVCDRTS